MSVCQTVKQLKDITQGCRSLYPKRRYCNANACEPEKEERLCHQISLWLFPYYVFIHLLWQTSCSVVCSLPRVVHVVKLNLQRDLQTIKTCLHIQLANGGNWAPSSGVFPHLGKCTGLIVQLSGCHRKRWSSPLCSQKSTFSLYTQPPSSLSHRHIGFFFSSLEVTHAHRRTNNSTETPCDKTHPAPQTLAASSRSQSYWRILPPAITTETKMNFPALFNNKKKATEFLICSVEVTPLASWFIMLFGWFLGGVQHPPVSGSDRLCCSKSHGQKHELP